MRLDQAPGVLARNCLLFVCLLGAGVLTACGDGGKEAAPEVVPTEIISAAPTADELFAGSCEAWSAHDDFDMMLNGSDGDYIERIKLALTLATEAAVEDPAKYKAYAARFQTYAEGVGKMVADQNAGADAMTIFDDMIAIEPPLGGCPKPPPDSGGLPLPSSTP